MLKSCSSCSLPAATKLPDGLGMSAVREAPPFSDYYTNQVRVRCHRQKLSATMLIFPIGQGLLLFLLFFFFPPSYYCKIAMLVLIFFLLLYVIFIKPPSHLGLVKKHKLYKLAKLLLFSFLIF